MDKESFGEQSNTVGGKRSFVSDIAWVKRGVAKAVPDKVEIEREDLRHLIQGAVEETSEDDDTEEAMEEDGERKNGLRGSAIGLTDNGDGIEKYHLEEYNKAMKNSGPTLKGLACFTSPLEDPHIVRHEDSDEEEEREDFELKPNDNLLVVAKVLREEEFSLQVHVYNEEGDDWYIHHDYMLDAPPLCLAAFTYDPGAESDDGKGNLLAVGTMDSAINVWDLDIVNAVKPVLTLGRSTLKQQRKRSKRDGTAQGHSDSVLCLDWNQLAEHVLASGSADKTMILWDLDEAKASTVVNFDSMIQSCQWHSEEQSVILTGTRNGEIIVLDCRTTEPSTTKWSLGDGGGVEVEKVAWNRFNPHYFFSVSDDGVLRYADSRKPGEFLIEAMAHEAGANSLSQSHIVEGLLTTIGSKELKVWRLSCNGPELQFVYTHPINMGEMNVVSFCPDSAYVLAVGAQNEEMIRLVDLAKYQDVTQAFGGVGG